MLLDHQTLEELLNSYRGRDKLLRILSYASLALSDVTSGRISYALKTVNSEFGHCRTVLRLLDDFLMFRYTCSYGLGQQEKDIPLRVLGVLNNFVDQIFYPVDHIAWAADKSILKIDGHRWHTFGTILWAISLYLHIGRCLRIFVIFQKKRQLILKECGGYMSEKSEDLLWQQICQLISVFQSSLDLINAINGMPAGVLWAGKLKNFSSGIIGMTSSLISLAMYLHSQK